MKDAIDKRNEREKIAKSIIKRWNVIYITKEELDKRRQEEERMKQNQEEREKADEVLKRIEDECKKAEEMQAILAQQEIEGHKNADTYGTTPMDGVTQEKVEAILNDKERMLQQIIQDTEMASAQQEMEENVGEELTEDNTTAEEKDAEEVSEVVEESEKEGASA